MVILAPSKSVNFEPWADIVLFGLKGKSDNKTFFYFQAFINYDIIENGIIWKNKKNAF